MSALLSLLLQPASAEATPNPPPPQPLAAPDATIEAMRPNLRSIATVEVGEGKQYTTLGAGIAAASAARTSAMQAVGQLTATPDYWVTILLYAGRYDENGFSLPRFASLYGMGADPGETVITGGWSTRSSGDTSVWKTGGVLMGGGTSYLENVTILMEPKDEASFIRAKYPLHFASGDTSTAIFVNSVIQSDAPSAGYAIGYDGGKDTTHVFYGCTINGPAAGFDNTHIRYRGDAASPGVISWVNCASNGQVSLHPYSSTEDATYADPAGDYYVIGPGFAPSYGNTRAGSIKHHVSTSFTGSLSGFAAFDTSTAWPVPQGGLSAKTRAKYYG